MHTVIIIEGLAVQLSTYIMLDATMDFKFQSKH